MAGFFVTFEGGEGSGKTTLIELLARELENRAADVVYTREPGATALGEGVRKLLLEKNQSVQICPRAEIMLFLTARTQNLEDIILPALAEDKVVLCDRYNDSTIAYQGYGREQDVSEVERICHLAVGGVEPNLTFFLDVDPKEGLKRLGNLPQEFKGKGDRIEEEHASFHERVRQGMQELAARYPERIYTIDAHQSPDEVFSEALGVLAKRYWGQ